MPWSDNPIFKAKANSLYPRVFLSIKKEGHSIRALLCAPRKKGDQVNNFKYCMLVPPRYCPLREQGKSLHTISTPLPFSLDSDTFSTTSFLSKTDQLERCLAFLKQPSSNP